jgi:putative hemolysin
MAFSEATGALVIFAALIFCNAFFVAAEYAIVRVRRTQLVVLAERGSAKARMARRVVDDLQRYVSTVQVGITGASLALGFVGEPTIARVIEPAFSWLVELSEPGFHVLTFVLAFGLISYVTLVAGELAPKYIAIQQTLPIVLWTAYPLHVISIVLNPFTWLVNRGAEALVRVVGIRPQPEFDIHSEEELKLLVAAATRQGILQESERVILENALGFADKLVRQVMVPRTEMVAVSSDATLGMLQEILAERPVAVAVYEENPDNIVGVLSSHDLVGRKADESVARDLMRPPLFVPEALPLDRALVELRRHRRREAVVVDEFGGTAGLATLDDILEELVGQLWYEGQGEVAEPIRRQNDGSFLIDGLAPVHQVRDKLGVALADTSMDSAGGIVMEQLGRLARVGDTIVVNGFKLEVVAIDGRRIATLRASGASPAPGKAAQR